VIPRARGGGRKDVRIIVPACARCNHHRGCRDLIPFLLAHPRRISAFIDYLGDLSPEGIRELDPRIFAELYVAIGILNECVAHGPNWRWERERLCSGRSLHRRRYAARRAVGAVTDRIEGLRDQGRGSGPTCLVPSRRTESLPVRLDEPLELLAARFLAVLALLWEVSADVVEREMTRELTGSAVGDPLVVDAAGIEEESEGVVQLDGWKTRRKRKRTRVDRRHVRLTRSPNPARGRAA
jgi:hypothetical protein